ncbi:MAG: Gfo/Idh/MocA family protein [Candidatus Tyrphobacter sp.]
MTDGIDASAPGMRHFGSALRPLRYGVVGCGYWGPNILRNLHKVEGATATWACDLDEARLQQTTPLYPELAITTRYQDLLQAGDVDVVVLATPISTHHRLGMEALSAGKHLLVEKPLASSVPHAAELVEKASAMGLAIGVDHTFLFTGAVRKIKELMAQQLLGDLYYVDSVRVNLGLFQNDVNVLWDLAPHDLSIIDFLLDGQMPKTVSAFGATHVGSQENIVYLTLRYESGVVAHVSANWLAPVKIRQMLVGGSRRMIVYNDILADEKIRVFDRGVDIQTAGDIYGALVQYRMGDMWAPRIVDSEALSLELEEFTRHVRDGSSFVSDGLAGLRVVRILAAADESMRADGIAVSLRDSQAEG